MTPNEYQKLALRTDSTSAAQLYQLKSMTKARLLNGLMGLNGEAGEAIDIFKKYLFQGHALNREHLAKELGGRGVVSCGIGGRAWIYAGGGVSDEY